jgi:hypothetical protein
MSIVQLDVNVAVEVHRPIVHVVRKFGFTAKNIIGGISTSTYVMRKLAYVCVCIK